MKIYRLATMNVYVEGFKYPQPKSSLTDLSWHLMDMVHQSNVLTPEEKQALPPDFITPDGDSDHMEHQGTINLYIGQLQPNILEALKSVIFMILDQLNISYSTTGPEQSGLYDSQVIRYHILENPEAEKFEAQPPQMNMANGNMRSLIQGILNLPLTEEGNTFSTDVILSKLNQVSSRDIFEFSHETTETQGIIEPGKDGAYWQHKIKMLYDIATWAKQHGFSNLYVQ